jgi:hypothetical protein
MRTVRTRATALALVGAAMLMTTTVTGCSSSKCGGQAFTESHGGSSGPLGSCGDAVGEPVSAPPGADPDTYNEYPYYLDVKVGETLTIGYGGLHSPPGKETFSGIASGDSSVLAVTSGVDGHHLGVFRAQAVGTSQITIDPLVACGSATIRCLIVTVRVTTK